MPLLTGKNDVSANIKELTAANKRREAEGKDPRKRAQIIAIALNATGNSNKK